MDRSSEARHTRFNLIRGSAAALECRPLSRDDTAALRLGNLGGSTDHVSGGSALLHDFADLNAKAISPAEAAKATRCLATFSRSKERRGLS